MSAWDLIHEAHHDRAQVRVFGPYGRRLEGNVVEITDAEYAVQPDGDPNGHYYRFGDTDVRVELV